LKQLCHFIDCCFQISNICSNTSAILGDAHGDGWNGATAHIDAYTGYNQFTFVPGTLSVAGLVTDVPAGEQTTVIKAEHNLGCLKDGCYTLKFEDIGAFPAEGKLHILLVTVLTAGRRSHGPRFERQDRPDQ